MVTQAPDRFSRASKEEVSFKSLLDEGTFSREGEPIEHPEFTLLPPELPIETGETGFCMTQTPPVSQSQGCLPYKEKLSDWEKYKDDQLLSNPGGDYYNLKEKAVLSQSKEEETFWDRIGKDISDSFDNLKNCFHNLFLGAKILYRDENDQIQEATQKGLLGSVGDFFKDLGSAFSFGTWRPDGEPEPEGFADRMGFFFSKMKEALFGDIFQGVGGSAIRSGESLVLAGWNLLEVIPDATVGNFEEGAKLTTTIFDNGQVAIDYLTDIIPTGEAWLRVHSPNFDDLNDAKAPVIYNIQLPERYDKDTRWKYVRNTPFRKTIETIGSLLADIAAVKVLGDSSFSSEGKKD
jgi:hypothetical protein